MRIYVRHLVIQLYSKLLEVVKHELLQKYLLYRIRGNATNDTLVKGTYGSSSTPLPLVPD